MTTFSLEILNDYNKIVPFKELMAWSWEKYMTNARPVRIVTIKINIRLHKGRKDEEINVPLLVEIEVRIRIVRKYLTEIYILKADIDMTL